MQLRRFVSFLTAALFLSGALICAAQEVPKLPDGHVGIHYYRADGSYNGWGLHLWESFEKVENGKITAPKTKSDQPLQGISWGSPMQSTGKSDFGLYWHIKADEFRNGKVNYILHKGDTKDQCGKDQAFFTPSTKEVFINAGDCNTYFSKDEAMKARK